MTSSWIDADATIAVAPHVLTRRVDDHRVLYNPTTDQISHLNPIGSIVWERIQTACRLGDLSDQLAHDFDIPADQIITDLAILLSALIDSGAALTRKTATPKPAAD